MVDLTPEQIAAQEAQALAEKEAAEVKAKNKKEALRELSKELGINAFEPEEIKAKFQEYNEWKESQKSEQDKLQEELNSYKTKETTWQSEKLKYESKLLGIDDNYIDDVLKLADNDPNKLPDIIKKYPNFKSKNNIQLGIQDPNNNKKPTDKTEQEQYIANNPLLRNYYGANKK